MFTGGKEDTTGDQEIRSGKPGGWENVASCSFFPGSCSPDLLFQASCSPDLLFIASSPPVIDSAA
jgi:hypothetical protein